MRRRRSLLLRAGVQRAAAALVRALGVGQEFALRAPFIVGCLDSIPQRQVLSVIYVAGTPFKRVDESEWVGSQFHVTKDNSYFALGLDQSE